jgi:hypothetical protein
MSMITEPQTSPKSPPPQPRAVAVYNVARPARRRRSILKAAEDAALGTFTVKVTGHPKTGADATREFKFTVAKK